MIALLVDRAVVPAAEQGEVGERGGAALGPVAHVMPLAERQAAAREATPSVPVLERAPQRRWNCPRPGSDFHEAPGFVMSHHHPARIARQALRRFRGNARPVLEHGLAWLIRVGQHLGIDVDHHLVPLSRGAGIEPVVQAVSASRDKASARCWAVVGGSVVGRFSDEPEVSLGAS
jgi:hypothetical protein